MRHFKTLAASAALVVTALVGGAFPAFASGFACLPTHGLDGSTTVCSISGGSLSATYDLYTRPSGSGSFTISSVNCTTDGSGAATCPALTVSGNTDIKATERAPGTDETPFFTWTSDGSGAVNGFSPTTLAAGFVTHLTAFASDFGPLILTVVGAALGLYGARLAYGFVTGLIRSRQASDRRRRGPRLHPDDV